MTSLLKTDFNVSKYRLIAQKREANAVEIEAALEVVREFIIKKKLILYGGIAIDYALHLKGSSIYPEGERPDFDMFSPTTLRTPTNLLTFCMKRASSRWARCAPSMCRPCGCARTLCGLLIFHICPPISLTPYPH